MSKLTQALFYVIAGPCVGLVVSLALTLGVWAGADGDNADSGILWIGFFMVVPIFTFGGLITGIGMAVGTWFSKGGEK